MTPEEQANINVNINRDTLENSVAPIILSNSFKEDIREAIVNFVEVDKENKELYFSAYCLHEIDYKLDENVETFEITKEGLSEVERLIVNRNDEKILPYISFILKYLETTPIVEIKLPKVINASYIKVQMRHSVSFVNDFPGAVDLIDFGDFVDTVVSYLLKFLSKNREDLIELKINKMDIPILSRTGDSLILHNTKEGNSNITSIESGLHDIIGFNSWTVHHTIKNIVNILNNDRYREVRK